MGSKIGELKVKFDKARSILSTMPGIDMSHTEQLDYYQTLLKQYKRENELLNSYKDICGFDISQLEQQPVIEMNKEEITSAPSVMPNESDLTKEKKE